jgi:hypothetical protein
MAAAYSRLRGLMLFPSAPGCALAGLAAALGGFLWFFRHGALHIPDSEGGLDGNRQAGLFAEGAALALVSTLLLTSLVNRRLNGAEGRHQGLAALKETTYLRALVGEVTALWRGRSR